MTSPTIEPATIHQTVVASTDSRTKCSGDLIWINRCPHLFRRPLSAIAWIVRYLIGTITLLALLSITAAVPVLNFFALGYLLEVEGQVARSGKLRHSLALLHSQSSLSFPIVVRGSEETVGMWSKNSAVSKP